MKILHSADWHLGAYVGPQCDDPMKRMENTIKCLDVLVETARREGPDIILVCGDIFHSAKVWSDRALIEVMTATDYLIRLLQIAPVSVLYGTPSHESLQSHYALEEMTKGYIGHKVYFFTQPGITTIKTKSGPIQIAGLPGFDKGHFRAQFPGLSAEEENQVFTQQLAQIVQGLSAQIDPAIPSVLMAHHTVVGCDMGNGTHIFQANEVVLDAATLDNSAFDLVCLGHIHKAQQVAICSVPMYYAGSIDASTFNDEGHGKGFWIHEMMGGYAGRHDFIETPAREFYTIRWEEAETRNYPVLGLYTINQRYCKDRVVRVLYEADSETEKALDKKKLERDLYAAGAYYVSEIRPEKVTASVNQDRMTEKLTPLDCLERYLYEKLKLDYHSDEFGGYINAAIPIIAEAQASSPMGTTSGLFLPVEIEVRNYRSYAEEKLSFEGIFFAMVNGKNGSGKSSLFMDAPCDCTYEETREKDINGWIKNREKSGSIKFTFLLGPDMWRITRTRQKSGKGTLALAKRNTTSDIFTRPEGGFYTAEETGLWEDKSCELMKDTQQKIIDLLGMDCNTFQSCVLIMQDRYGKFMEASKEDRMNVLASLLGLNIYDELEKLAKAKLTDANRDVKTLKEAITKIEADISTDEGLRTEQEQIEASLACANNDLKTAREELAGYQKQLTEIEGFVREMSTLEQEIKAKTDNYTDKKARKEKLENDVFVTESFLKNEQTILDKCAELDKTRLAIASLDGKVQLLNDKKSRCAKVNLEIVQIKNNRNSISGQLKAISENLKDKDEMEAIVKDSTVEADLEEYDRRFLRHQARNTELQATKIKASNYAYETDSHIQLENNTIKSLLKQVSMLDDTNCIDVKKAQCRFLQSAKNAEQEIIRVNKNLSVYQTSRQLEQTSFDDAVNNLIKQISELAYDTARHEELKKSAKTHREAKDRLSKMAADSATANELFKQHTELGSKLNELDIEIKELSDGIVVLEKDTGGLAGLKSAVDSLLRYEKQKMDIPKAKQFVLSSNEQIEQLIVDLSGLQEDISKANIRLAELQEKTIKLPGLKNDIFVTESDIKHIENQVNMFNQSIGTIKAKLGAIFEQKQLLTEKKLDLEKSAKEASQLQVLVEAFSQDGIPYQIIRDIVPELEAAANEILGQMTGGRMRLEFITEKVLKSNKAKEVATLEIIIIDVDNGTLPYLSRSGGQKVRAALAVNFALANIKASRVGLQLGMMFVDEPPFLDADGVEAYCAALETIHNKYPEMKLLAISHDENMKTIFPQQLYVDITENGSKVRRL